ncbi:hypothetical protein [Pedobacter sp. N23S346]|uniref:hypothetical protein n=1 Tax=Pedobacter sp. N23S346 TaxID=3402750 RepID=UPI003AD3069E
MKTQLINGKTTLVFNTPKCFDFDAFGKFGYTKANKAKLIFLIHQINYWSQNGGDYNLHYKAHYEMLGLSPNDLQSFLSMLVSQKIITLSSAYNNGQNGGVKKCNHYKIIKPFSYQLNAENVDKHFFNLEDKRCPLFIKKFVGDDFKVCCTEYSNSAKELKTLKSLKPLKKVSKSSTPDEKDLIIAQMAKEIELLKAALKGLSNNTSVAQIKAPEVPKVESNTSTSTKEITADNGHKFILENANEYTDEMIQLIKAKYRRTLPMILCDGIAFIIEKDVLKERIKEPELN